MYSTTISRSSPLALAVISIAMLSSSPSAVLVRLDADPPESMTKIVPIVVASVRLFRTAMQLQVLVFA